MTGIAFTQFLMPDGRQVPTTIMRPEAVAAIAEAVVRAGGRFEIEMLSTGEISMTVEHPDFEADDRGPVAIECCANGPDVPAAVDRLIVAAAGALGVAA